MAKILSDVRTVVRSYLDEASDADWTDSELNKLINHRYHRVYTAVIAVYEDYYITTDLFNTTASREEYTTADGVASDIYKIRRIEVNYDVSASTSTPTRLFPVQNMDAIRRDLGYQNAGIGLRVSSGGNYYTFGFGSNITIGIIPVPDKTGTNAGKIWYIQQLADLSLDADTVNIPYADRYYHMIAQGATGDALRFGQQDSPEADKLDAKFERDLTTLQEELEDRIAEETKTVMDISGDFLDMG